MGEIKNMLKKVPGLKWIADTNKKIYDLQEQTKKLQEEKNDLEEKINKISGEVLLNNKETKIDKLAIYTVLINSYDELNEPLKIEDKYCDYYCFTDNKDLKSNTWKVIYVDKGKYRDLKNCDAVKFARYIKTHPQLFLKGYKHSLFIDANLTINKSLIGWICLYSNGNDLLTFKHPDRDCIYKEGKRCIEMGKDDPNIISKQLARYKKEGYPENNGLVMTNMIYRKHTSSIKKFDDLWWDEIKKESRRDQLSFNYVLDKTKLKIDLCPLHAAFNDYFIYNYHKNEKR